MPRRSVEGARIPAVVGPFSAGVHATPSLFLSGQIGQDPATGRLVDGGAATQARQVFTNIVTVLEAAGRTEADIIRVGIYLTDMGDLADVNEVYREFFEAPFPARTAIAVVALPGGALVEADAVVA